MNKKHLLVILCLFYFIVATIGFVSANENNTLLNVDNSQDTLISSEYNDSQVDTKFLVDDFVKYFHNSSQLEFNLVDVNGTALANETVNILIHDVNYTRTTNETGTGKMNINLSQGNYTAYLIYNGNNKYKSTSIAVSVTVLPLIKSNDIIKYFKNETQFFTRIFNNDGTSAIKSKVTYNINGVFYSRTTNSKGSAMLPINLNPGTYIVTSMYYDCFVSNNITVLSTIESNDLVKYFRNDSQFTIGLLDKKGNAAVNKTVVFNVNGVIYERVTDVYGLATLNINFATGKYIITTSFDGLEVSNNITVLSTILSEDIVLSTSNRIPFSATVLNGKGNAIAGEKLSFEVNGIVYDRVSKEDGSASLNINLNVGRYSIKTCYNGLTQLNNITVKS